MGFLSAVASEPPLLTQPVPVDAIVAVLNPVRARDCETHLRTLPLRLRVPVALACAELDERTWALTAGFWPSTVHRWLRQDARLPFGAAYRLARVIGVEPEILFAGHL